MKNNKINLIPSQIVSKTLPFLNDINTQLNKDSVLNQTYGVNRYQQGGVASDSTMVNRNIPKLKPKFSEVTKELFKTPQTRNAELYLQNREQNIDSQNNKALTKNLVRAGLETLPLTSTVANAYGLVENAAKGNGVDAASYAAGLGASFLPIPNASKFAANLVRQGLKKFNQLGTVNTATGKSFNDYRKGGELPASNKNIIPNGVLHKNRNNLPKELGFGGKGIPVVACVNDKCEKTAEIESNELILTRDNSKILDRLVNKYKNGGASLQDIGKFFQEQVLHNTHNNTKDFKHLSKIQKKITK